MKEKRITEMEKFINENSLCSLDELCKKFNVSLSTVRRDIDSLAVEGRIKKINGGVKSISATSIFKYPNSDSDIFSNLSQLKNYNELDTIGKLASSEVSDNDIIYIGSGITTLHMLPYLKEKKNLTIITNNLLISYYAKDYDFNILFIGGKINYYSLSTVGVHAIELLHSVNAQKAFISCNGVTIKQGFSNAADSECAIKKTVLAISSKIIMMVDSSKFDKLSLYTFATFKDIDCLVTEKLPGKDFQNIMASNNVKLIASETSQDF